MKREKKSKLCTKNWLKQKGFFFQFPRFPFPLCSVTGGTCRRGQGTSLSDLINSIQPAHFPLKLQIPTQKKRGKIMGLPFEAGFGRAILPIFWVDCCSCTTTYIEEQFLYYKKCERMCVYVCVGRYRRRHFFHITTPAPTPLACK